MGETISDENTFLQSVMDLLAEILPDELEAVFENWVIRMHPKRGRGCGMAGV
jgi:hypothetical protein